MKGEVIELKDVVIALSICAIFIVLALILPIFDFFIDVQVYPLSWNILTLYVLFLLLLTLFTIYYFGKGPIINSFVNFKRYAIMNMETLVALGTLSAIIMAIFLIGVYFKEV